MADAHKAELLWSSTADDINERNQAYNVSYYKAEWARSPQNHLEKK